MWKNNVPNADVNEITNLGEREYAQYLLKQGTHFFHPAPRLKLPDGMTYQPDFSLPETDQHIEVIGSNTAFYANQSKVISAQRFFEIKYMRPDGRELGRDVNNRIIWKVPKLKKARDCDAVITGDDRVLEILKAAASPYRVNIDDLKGKKKPGPIVRARQVAMYLIKGFTDLSFAEIGREFGNRHHSTVMHACAVVSKRKEQDPATARVIEEIIRVLSCSQIPNNSSTTTDSIIRPPLVNKSSTSFPRRGVPITCCGEMGY